MEFKQIVQFTKSITQKNKSLEDVLKALSPTNKKVTFTFIGKDNIEYKTLLIDNTNLRAGDLGYTYKLLSPLSEYQTESGGFTGTKGGLYKALVRYMNTKGFKERKGITSHVNNLLGLKVEFEEDKGLFD